ncbi:MAG: hypothetical protein GYA62_00705 [Bacteroidales bacterium]|nr:hypothetical protein [Bacteroidales bacterium]
MITNIQTSVILTGIRITWTDSESSSAIQIYRSKDGGAYSLLTTIGYGVQSYDDEDTEANSTYVYKLRAVSRTTISTDKTAPQIVSYFQNTLAGYSMNS